MQSKTLMMAVMWIAFGLLAAAPFGGSAAKSSYGANYSYEQNGGTSNFQTVCDRENDQDNAYSDFGTVSSGYLRVTDSNGSAGSCGWRTSYSAITEHVTCEDHDFAPDGCGRWVAATT